MDSLSIFDVLVESTAKEVRLLEDKLVKLIIMRGAELDLTEEQRVQIRTEIYDTLGMNNLRENNVVSAMHRTHATHKELLINFQEMMAIFSESMKLFEKIQRKYLRAECVEKMSLLIKEHLKDGLNYFRRYLTTLV